MGDSFDALALAATAQKDMMEQNATPIATLITSIAALTVTNKLLAAQLATALGQGKVKTKAPPGLPPPITTPTSATTGSAANSAGVLMTTKTNRFGDQYFTYNQACGSCDYISTHIPANCLALPQNAVKK